MIINFSTTACQSYSDRKHFGICDDPPPPHKAAYVDEVDETKWIAVVINDDRYNVLFTAIDHCIELKRPDGKSAKRCDGFLTFNDTVIFVELKERGGKRNDWVKDAEKQLRKTIEYFELEDDAKKFSKKRAYIANKERPEFKESQVVRMAKFFDETGYILRVEARIIL